MKLIKNTLGSGFQIVSDKRAETFLKEIEGKNFCVQIGRNDYMAFAPNENKVIVVDITDEEAEVITRLIGDRYGVGVGFYDFGANPRCITP